MTEEPVPPPSKRRALTFAGVSIFVAILIVLTLFWAWPLFQSTKGFEEPKLTTARLDEQPFMRMDLRPGESYRPLEVMTGTTVTFRCEVVARSPAPPRFLLNAWGHDYEGADCVFQLPVPDQPGLASQITVTFFDGGGTRPTDRLDVPTLVVPSREGIEFHALEDLQHATVAPGSVPDQVFVYARAITSLPGDGRDFVAMFFTSDPSNGVPVLELMPMKEGDQPQPMIGSVVRYRSYGPNLSGYAFWSPQPVRIGGRDGNRAVTDLRVGIFRRDLVASLFLRLLKVEVSGPETVTVTPLVLDASELESLTVGGHLLSPPLHVVRGPASAAESETRRVVPN